MNNREILDECDQQILDLKKKNPEIFEALKDYYEETDIKPSLRSKGMALELARAHKKKLAEERFKASFLSKIYNKLAGLFRN